MDWNLKNPLQWDWENLALFCEKESEMSRNAKQTEWIADGGVISNGSMYSSGSGTCSGSELGNGSSKNSVTVSVGSSSKAGNKISVVNFEENGGFLDNQNNICEIDLGDDTRTAHVTGSGEPLIGLKLGKRTYFENLASADVKMPSCEVSLMPPAASVKRSRACHQAVQAFYCQVEGCNIDLTTAKDYHRKHRVCECHSKSPKVIVAGHDRRFCQQCSRFHDLSEFDQKKRSCRRRLSEHNARRRKPQAETLSFNPTMLPSAFYEERQQMDFFLNLAPLSHLRVSTSSLRDDSPGFSISMTKGTWNRTKAVADAQALSPKMNFTNAGTSSGDEIIRLLPAKCAIAEVLNQGLEASASASNMNGAPDLRRALSLLSSDAWVPSSTAQSNAVHLASSSAITASPPFQVVPSAPESWQDDHTLTFNFHDSGSQAQELHFSKGPYESSIFEANEVLEIPNGC